MPSYAKEMIGKKFGNLRIIERAGSNKHGMAMWLCKCDCGASYVAEGCRLRKGNTKSCGCLKKTHAIKHHDSGSSEYWAWVGAKDRCNNPNSKHYKDYGGRNVTMCASWQNSYENFLRDMGRKPSTEYSLDRVNVNGNYEPSNCRWATPEEQANNRRDNNKILYRGKSQTLSRWSRELNLNLKTLDKRYRKGDRGDYLFRPAS